MNNMEKKKYINPSIDMIVIQTDDIIATSDPVGGQDDVGGTKIGA